MKNMISAFSILFFAAQLNAGEFKNVTMPDEITVAGKKLVLNGMGLREVTKMGMDFEVYIGGLYVEKKTCSGEEVMYSKGVRDYKMHYLRNVTPKQTREFWDDQYKDYCPGNDDKMKADCKDLMPSLEAFKKLSTEIEKGQIIDYIITGKGVTMQVNGKDVGKVDSEALAHFVFAPTMSKKPISEMLQGKLLGKPCK